MMMDSKFEFCPGLFAIMICLTAASLTFPSKA